MKSEDLKILQAPLKEKYRNDPSSAIITLKANGRIGEGISCKVEEDPERNVKITYQFHGDPAGKIPGWLANSVVVSNPFKTLKNLKRLIAKMSN